MKLLLILLCAVAYHCCNGFPVIDGEISKEILTGNDTSVEYLLETTNDTSSNDSLLQHGFFKKVGGGTKSNKRKIGFKDNSGSGRRIGGGHYIGGTRTNSGSGVRGPGTVMWALIGVGLVFLVTLVGLALYFCQTHKTKRYNKCEVQQINEM